MVARLVRDQEVVGSSPVTSTTETSQSGVFLLGAGKKVVEFAGFGIVEFLGNVSVNIGCGVDFGVSEPCLHYFKRNFGF